LLLLSVVACPLPVQYVRALFHFAAAAAVIVLPMPLMRLLQLSVAPLPAADSTTGLVAAVALRWLNECSFVT
jgi:hypothetical protein